MSYAGFWQRFGAFWLDFIAYIPVIIFSVWLMGKTQAALTIWLLPGAAIGVWFSVYLVKRYGGTPGKLMMGLRIVRVDGSTVGYKEAFLRYLPLFVLGLLMSTAYILGSWSLSEVEYLSLDWKERQDRLTELAPSWYRPVYLLEQIWMWSEFLVMMTNRKRRALHDFLAGTVVVKVNDAPATEPAIQGR